MSFVNFENKISILLCGGGVVVVSQTLSDKLTQSCECVSFSEQ